MMGGGGLVIFIQQKTVQQNEIHSVSLKKGAGGQVGLMRWHAFKISYF